MQGAEFGADHQHHGVRIRLAERFGGAQCREGGVAAHETEVIPLDGGIQAEGPDDFVVRAGIEKPGAGHRDQMSYVKSSDARAGVQGLLGRLDEELGGLGGEDVVADLGAGAEQQPGAGVERTADSPPGVRGQFLNGRVAGVDGRGVKAGVDQPGCRAW